MTRPEYESNLLTQYKMVINYKVFTNIISLSLSFSQLKTKKLIEIYIEILMK